MKKPIAALLVLFTVFALFSSLAIQTNAAFTAQLDRLQINAGVIDQSPDLKEGSTLSINEGDRIYILGWIAVSYNDGLKEIRYKINGTEYACSDNYRNREDVWAAGIAVYNKGEHAGFGHNEDMMELTGVNELAPGSYTLTLTAYTNGGYSYDFKTYTLKVKTSEAFCLEALQVNGAVYGETADRSAPSRLTVYHKDRVYVLGWAAFSASDGLDKIVYEADGTEYPCRGSYKNRPDLPAAGVPVYNNGEHAGFGAEEQMLELAGISELSAGEHSVSVYAVSAAGKRMLVKSFALRILTDGAGIVPGDVNGDGTVNGLDLIRLRKYLAGYDTETKTAPVFVYAAGEATGDGALNGRDLIRLRKYLADLDSSTGISSVVLQSAYSAEYPGDNDDYAGDPVYTENGDTITVDGKTYPNTADMKNGALYATDDLYRELTPEDGYVYNGEKNVGLFYFLWLGEHGDHGIFDITKILQQGGSAAKSASYSGWGPVGAMHFWGEPLYGYYFSRDAWVMRKHIEELTAAGVDFLYIDATNGFPYVNNALQLMKIMHEYNEQGFNAPKIVFYTHSSCSSTVRQIYNGVYGANKYPDTWFYLDGKPLIIAYQNDCRNELSSNIYNFFSYREPQWPNERQKQNGWPWMDFTYPQRIFVNYRGENEAISVSVAQHCGTVRFSDSAIYGDTTNRGRSWRDGSADNRAGSTLYGYNLEQQFERAIQADVPYILVTGWNEWVAQRQDPGGSNRVIFVDTCSMEYSRDIEPMKGGYFDNYYIQLTDLIRRYKGSAPTLIRNERKRIDVTGGFEQWDGVTAGYTDPSGDTADRNSKGFGNKTLTDQSGNNDIVKMKVVYDTQYLYFYAETASEITHYDTSKSWMQLFLDSDHDGGTGFYGFDYIVNYAPTGSNITSVCKCERTGDTYEAVSTGYVLYKTEGNKIMIRVPLASVGIYDYNDIALTFKWVDSDTKITSAAQMYSEGDAAPIGRFGYDFRNR